MTRLIISLLRAYQSLSKSLGPRPLPLFASTGCRSWPTCSDYTVQAIQEHGPIRGLAKGVVRLARCNPFFSPQSHR